MAWTSSELVTWDDDGLEVRYPYDYFIGDADALQGSWWLVDEDTGENLGQVHQVFTGFTAWHPAAPVGSTSISLIESRKHHALHLQQENGETWNVAVHPDYQVEGAYLSYWVVTTSPTGQEQSVEVRYVPVSAPVSTMEGGFTLLDDTAGDSQWFPSASTPLDFAQWYPPATATLGLRVSASRWNNELCILYPTGESTLLVRGNLQGLWSTDKDGNSWFTSYGWFGATALVHPGAPWVLWDATRNEYVPADEGTTTDFIGTTDNTDTDGDGLPDWYEFIIGTNWNNADSDGDGYSDGWEVARSYNPLDLSDPPATLDSDGDGIPDRWEMAHGLSPFYPDDATEDWDEDGFTNLQEFQAGTDMNEGSSTPVTPFSGELFGLGEGPQSVPLILGGGDPGAVTYEILTGPTLGTLSGDGHSLSYQRTAAGEDSIQFVLHQGSYTSPVSTITIHNDLLRVPVEVAGHGLTLQGRSAGNPVNVPWVNLGLDDTGHVRVGIDITGLDPGVQVTLQDPITGWSHAFVPTQDRVMEPDTTNFPHQGASVFSFAVDEERRDHVLGLVLPGMNLTFPVIKTDAVGTNVYVEGVASWSGFGFFNAYAQTGLATFSGSFRLVDLTTREQSPANATNLTWQEWEPLDLALVMRPVTIVVPFQSSPNQPYVLHTSSGFNGWLLNGWLSGFHGWVFNPWLASWSFESRMLPRAYPQNGAVHSVDGSFSNNWCTRVTGKVGVGETFWLTRGGASSPQMSMGFGMGNAGPLVVDWSSVPPPANAGLVTQSFKISQDLASHVFAVVQPDGTRHYLYPDWNLDWQSNSLATWDDNGSVVQHSYRQWLGQTDPAQGAWSLLDVTTGLNFGQTTDAFPIYLQWHPAAPAGWASFNLAESRKYHPLRVVQDNGERWNVALEPAYQVEGAHLSSPAIITSPTGQEQAVEVRYVPVKVPFSASGGYTLVDAATGDSQSFPTTGVVPDLSQWYLPATALGLRVSASRWDSELSILYPNGESAELVRGTLQGTWSTDATTGNVYFTSTGWFDATAQVHPGAPWALWDATRNEFVAPEEGTTTDFINSTDITDSDGDGLPDWYELAIGTDPNLYDTDGDGFSDFAEVVAGSDPGNAAIDPSTPSAPEAFALTVSLSRWGHDLRVRQSSGGEFPITSDIASYAGLPPSSVGGTQVMAPTWDGSIWTPGFYYNEFFYYGIYQPYFVFSATGQRRLPAGADWWIHDATTGEDAPLNTVMLHDWTAVRGSPTEVHATQTATGGVSVTWQFDTLPAPLEDFALASGGAFFIERQNASGGGWSPVFLGDARNMAAPEGGGQFFRDAGNEPAGTCFYRVSYWYCGKGGAPVESEAITVWDPVADSDGDGIPDLWEVNHGMNPLDPSDGIADWDGDGFFNRDEFLAGTDLNDPTSTPPLPNEQFLGTDGLHRIDIPLTATGGDPDKTTFKIVRFAEYPHGATPEESYRVGNHEYIYYQPPQDILLGRYDAVYCVAKQGDWESPPAPLHIWNQAVVSVVSYSPGFVISPSPGTTGVLVPRIQSFRSNNERLPTFAILQRNNDNDNQPTAVPAPRDNADPTIGTNDNDIVMIELTFNPTGLDRQYSSPILHLPPGVRAFRVPEGGCDLPYDLQLFASSGGDIGLNMDPANGGKLILYLDGLDEWNMGELSLISNPIGGGDPKLDKVFLLPLFEEVTPLVKDENGNTIPLSNRPEIVTNGANEMVKEPRPGKIPNIAYRILRVKFPATFSGEPIRWTMAEQFTPGGEAAPRFRGNWPVGPAELHPNRFEASDGPTNYYAFNGVSQEVGETILDVDGETALRINVPPIGFNKARVRLLFASYPEISAVIDFEVPAIVVIDPGHGGKDSGTKGRTDNTVKESDLALAYGIKLREELIDKFEGEKRGLRVIMTRKVDEFIELEDRAPHAKNNCADVFVSIHFNNGGKHDNGTPNTTARGTETFVERAPGNQNQDDDASLAALLQQSTVAAIQAQDAGGKHRPTFLNNWVLRDSVPIPRVKQAGFAVTKDGLNYNGNTHNFKPVKACLIEVEFLTHETALNSVKLSSATGTAIKDAFADRAATAIFNNILNQP
jgi:N-acetylmuramoyl-L-alanine amidase